MAQLGMIDYDTVVLSARKISMDIDQFGPYRIVRKIGHGGMGTVYEGMNLETNEPAAIKLLSAAPAQREGLRERFDAEVKTLLKLRHPNIVRLFGFGEQDGQVFYAMELVDGNSLEQELARGLPWPGAQFVSQPHHHETGEG